WTQPLGCSHAIGEIVIDTLKRSANPLDRAANRYPLKATDLQTLTGPVNFSTGPHPNVLRRRSSGANG
ncbi:MAG: ABC transporter substrate-binding protein, partial [Pseudomonadota bacterium]